MALTLTSYGGAEAVTGSNFLVEGKNGKIVVDCGIEQGKDFCETCSYESFPYDVSSVDALVITHAHLDHIGRAPRLLKEGFKNCGAIADDKVKSEVLRSSIFAVAKSGTISLEICNAGVPSVIIYKMNFINFLIVKMLVKVKFANIINISSDKEIIPELLQSKCNSKNIYNTVDKLLSNSDELNKQLLNIKTEIDKFKTGKSSELASSVLINHL